MAEKILPGRRATLLLGGPGNTAPIGWIIPSTATTGLQIYNTADQTTNYERLEALWSGNVSYLRATQGGTGSARNLRLGAGVLGANYLEIGANGRFSFVSGSIDSGPGPKYSLGGSATFTGTSGSVVFTSLTPTYNQASGTAANTDLLINRTETAVGSGAQLLIDAQVGGVSKFSVSNAGAVTTGAGITIPASSGLSWNGRGRIFSSGSGNIQLSNTAVDGFNLLQFGGTTSSFPALKRNSTGLDARLADDSAYTVMRGSRFYADDFFYMKDGTTAPTATAGEVKIYVDGADGDLKVIFGDGTVKTIVTDT